MNDEWMADPPVCIVLTPAQFEAVKAMWEPTGITVDLGFWGLPVTINDTVPTGWIERLSGAREPIPLPDGVGDDTHVV